RLAAQVPRPRGCDVPPVRQREDERRNEAEQPDGDLEATIQRRRARVAVGAAAQQPGAETEPSHVRGDDRRPRLDRGAARLGEQAYPEELIDESRGAG